MSELRSKMIRAMELKDYSDRTQETYLGAVKQLAKFHGKSPELLNQKEVEDYLLHLKKSGKSTSTRNVALAAIRFLYDQVLKSEDISLSFPSRRRPKILPEVLSKSEVVSILDAHDNIKHRVILMTAYSAGLRLSEIAHLKIEHINSARSSSGFIRERAAKIAIPCFPSGWSKNCGSITRPIVPTVGSFTPKSATGPLISHRSKGSIQAPRKRPVSKEAAVFTRCVTALEPIYWKPDVT